MFSSRLSDKFKAYRAAAAKPLAEAPIPSPEVLKGLLKKHFGHEEFRSHQLEVTQLLCAGGNVFASMKTGVGKSLCFQIPALLAPQGVTLVVSPLKALMNDQVTGLQESGIPAAALHSDVNREEESAVWSKLSAGKLKLLYVSPERLDSQGFKQRLAQIGVRVNRLVVDEAHCVSMWGHDFRWQYLTIAQNAAELGNPPMAAFTATAPLKVREDVLKLLNMQNAIQVIGDVRRDNLKLSITHFAYDQLRSTALIDHLQKVHCRGECTIVFFPRIHSLEKARHLAEQHGIFPAAYHGRLDGLSRRNIEHEFREKRCNLIFATSAWGMGMDRPDVRNIIHYGPTASLEEYWQQVGRGGRDGQHINCILMLSDFDFYAHHRSIDRHSASAETLQRAYERFTRFGVAHDRDEPQLVPGFNLEKFLLSARRYQGKFKEDLLNEHFGKLVEYGLFSPSPDGLIVNYPPARVAKEGFPISAARLETHRAARIRHLDIMEHFTRSSDLSRIIEDHFVANSIESRVEVGARRRLNIDATQSDAVLTAIASRPQNGHINGLASYLTNSRSIDKSAARGALSYLAPQEVELLVEQLEGERLITRIPIGLHSYWGLTSEGEARRGTRTEVLQEPRDYQDVTSAIFVPASQTLVRKALQKWYQREHHSAESTNSWPYMLDAFLSEKFEVCGKAVSGRKLIADCTLLSPKSIALHETRDFLTMLFPAKPIAASADELHRLDTCRKESIQITPLSLLEKS